jgi:hypothetical protein
MTPTSQRAVMMIKWVKSASDYAWALVAGYWGGLILFSYKVTLGKNMDDHVLIYLWITQGWWLPELKSTEVVQKSLSVTKNFHSHIKIFSSKSLGPTLVPQGYECSSSSIK